MNREGYITKYGEEEGIRRWKKSEYNKRWHQAHHKELLEHQKQYYKAHQEERLEYNRRWHQACREERLEYNKQYRQEHRKELIKYLKQYRKEHQEELLKYRKQYQETPYGRALNLIRNYRQSDRQQNRGDCTLTAQWVVDKIFTRSCLYCGESDWQLLGCDRIDNSKPHTPNNVVCSCGKCNKKRHTKDFLKFAYSIGAKDSDNLIIKY